MKKLIIYIALISLLACSKSKNHEDLVAAPLSWYNSDAQMKPNSPHREEGQDLQEVAQSAENSAIESSENQVEEAGIDSEDEPKKLAQQVDSIFEASSEAIEEGDTQANEALGAMSLENEGPAENRPPDWVPWRFEYLMTDLSLTGSGLIGALTAKGTATVRAFWRRQGPKPTAEDYLMTAPESEKNEEPILTFNENTTTDDILRQMEPAVKLAVATGKVKDTPDLRKNLLAAGEEFQMIAMCIPSNDAHLPWWVSRFRLDFSVDAAGRVEPVGYVGGEVRFRFEWHRIKRKETKFLPTNYTTLTARQMKLKDSIKDFVTNTAGDLQEAFNEHSGLSFKAHQIRIGIGISVKGELGVIKGAAGIVGQIYFNREVHRPVLYPVKPKSLLADSEDTNSSFYIIEKNPIQSHIQLAQAKGISFESQSSGGNFTEVIYKIDRKLFRKGLKKAAKISKFFAKRAQKSNGKKWKVYELRTAFDASLSGGLDAVTIGGSTTAQISMFNENF